MRGFTLIEMSIVLVIIGLIVGGVLVGQDLVRAAEVRAQITQIEKYNQAVNTFRGKYGYLPGDMIPTAATQFGFSVGAGFDGVSVGHRNGDGLIDDWPYPFQLGQGKCENAAFWQDLSFVNLIDGAFPNSGIPAANCNGGTALTLSGSLIGAYFPPAKIGRGNYVYAYEVNSINYYGVAAITSTVNSAIMTSNATIPVMQAYNMDAKIDDGIPNAGKVVATYINNSWTLQNAPNTATSGGTAASCYDTTSNTYSITPNGGSGANCALSFQFQ